MKLYINITDVNDESLDDIIKECKKFITLLNSDSGYCYIKLSDGSFKLINF